MTTPGLLIRAEEVLIILAKEDNLDLIYLKRLLELVPFLHLFGSFAH